jgi:glycosyltransferase involved in cell wall biosynthesis
MNENATTWLDKYLHPIEDVPFSLPEAIHFLLKFRPDLANYECQTIRGRMLIYFWWKAYGERDYRDFDWCLREQDISYLRQFDAETLITKFPECIALWLMGHGPDVLDRKALLVVLTQHRRLSLTEFVVFPFFLDVIVDSRPDLCRAFDCSTFQGQVAALHWWDSTGCQEYSRLNWRGADVWDELNEYLPHPEFAEVHAPHFLAPLLQSREDFPATMKTASLGALIDAAKWWDQTGYKEYPYLRWNTAPIWSFLSELDEESPGHLPLPRFAQVLLNHRPDLAAAFQIDNLVGQIVFFEWWNNHGRIEYPRFTWNIWRDILATEPVNNPDHPRIPRFLAAIWSERNDLQSIFHIESVDGANGLVHWWQERGRNEYGFINATCIQRDADNLSFQSSVNSTFGSLPHGVNVIGFPQGMLGLGEDARVAALAIETLSVPVVVVNAPISGPAKREHSADRLLSENLRYGISMFCLPPAEMIRLALEGGRHIIESNTYKIGAWPWELPHWPEAFGRADDLVNEIWAQSRYVESVYSTLGRKPVFHMPMTVQIPRPVNPDRRRFGLAEGRFLFYLMFDGNSWLSRKNPMAGVHAFHKAFGSGNEPVGLVVKAMNVRDDDPEWQAIYRLAVKDSSRIKIISEHLSRQDTIDFMASCDAYISLHRAEGFGRVIAEAMLLEQPVVATNFSGNLDFCTQKTSYLVDGALVPLRNGDYLFHDGQYWCDPDIDIAAAQLRCLYENPVERANIAFAGRARVENDYSQIAVANAYRQRLKEITCI